MTEKNDALFLVRLPFDQKTIPYEAVPKLIAMAKSPGYDIEKASGDEDVIFELDVGLEERLLRAAVHAGEVGVLSKSLHRMGPPFMGRLENTVLTVRAFRGYLESIHGFLEVDDAPEQVNTKPQAAPSVAKPAYKKWTAEKLAELNSYRDGHTMPETASKFGISQQRIRQLLPSEKPAKKGYSAFTHHIK